MLPSTVGYNLYGVYCNSTGELRGDIKIIVKVYDAADKLLSTSVADGNQLFGTMVTVLPGKRVQFSLGTEQLTPDQKFARVTIDISTRKRDELLTVSDRA